MTKDRMRPLALLYVLIILGSLYSSLFFRELFSATGFHSPSQTHWLRFFPESDLVGIILIAAKIILASLCLFLRKNLIFKILLWFVFNALLIYQPMIDSGGDELTSFLLGYLMIHDWKENPLPPFRLLSFYLGSVYLGNAITKVGALWTGGRAVLFFFLNPDLIWPIWSPVRLPGILATLGTYGTYVFEGGAGLFLLGLAIAPKSWQRSHKNFLDLIFKIMMLSALGFHGVLFFTIRLGFFPLYFIICWLILNSDREGFFADEKVSLAPSKSLRNFYMIATVILVSAIILGNLKIMKDASNFNESAKNVIRVFDKFRLMPPQSFFTPQPPQSDLHISWRLDLTDGSTEIWSDLDWFFKKNNFGKFWPDPYETSLLLQVRGKPEVGMELANYICTQSKALRVQPTLTFRSLLSLDEIIAKTSYPIVSCPQK